MLPMMLPCCDFMMARQRALEASVSIATVKMFPEARCRQPPLRTAIANVPDSKPTVLSHVAASRLSGLARKVEPLQQCLKAGIGPQIVDSGVSFHKPHDAHVSFTVGFF